MSTSTDAYLLWVDIETTGLDPQSDYLLEVAAVLTTFDAEFRQIGQPFDRVLALPSVPFSAINQTVLEMHTKNGLWSDCRRSSLSRERVEEEFSRWLSIVKNNARLPFDTAIHPAGRSVHFDLDWLPDLGFSHRRFDLTPIKAYATMAGIGFDTPEDAHRARADIEADIALARRLVEAAR